jgi:hypothetical protein
VFDCHTEVNSNEASDEAQLIIKQTMAKCYIAEAQSVLEIKRQFRNNKPVAKLW